MRTSFAAGMLILLAVPGCTGEAPQAPQPAAPAPEEPPVQAAASFEIEPPAGTWRLISFGDATEVSEPEVTFQVEPDGALAGASGCNRYTGRWTVAAGKAAIGPLAGTRMMCPPEVMQVEDRFLREMGRVAGWRPHVDGMILVDGSSEPLLVFEKVL